jgi:hypothetical protein
MDSWKFPRRTLLQRGLLAIAGALGLVAAERRPGAQAVAAASMPEPTPAAAGALRLYGRGWRPQPQSPLLGRGTDRDHRVGYAELVDAPTDGAVIGRFCTNGLCPQTPFSPAVAASPTIEFQTLSLDDGTVFGVGAGSLSAAEQTFAILGGTGRFAGARGTYTARLTSFGADGGAIEFTLTLAT